jgi:hypothetical protein
MPSGFDDAGGRDLVALRVVPVLPDGAAPDPVRLRDAGWLVRRGARIGAVGFAAGSLVRDDAALRVRFNAVEVLAVPRPRDRSGACAEGDADPEAALVGALADRLLRLSSPLVVTCGGRGFDLPFLRYRALAHGRPLAALHRGAGRRLVYFDRFDPDWHFDLADVLAGHGASRPLGLEDLCALVGLGRLMGTADPAAAARRGARAIALLFLGTLRVMDRLDADELRRAADRVAEMPDDAVPYDGGA